MRLWEWQLPLTVINPVLGNIAYPRAWEYPEGAIIKRLNSQGCLDYNGGCYFVCEAMADEYVQIESVESSLLVIYQHM